MSHWMLAVSSERLSLHNSTNKPAIYLPLVSTICEYAHYTLSLLRYSERRLLNNGGTPLCSACVINVSKRFRNSSPMHSNMTIAQVHKYTHLRLAAIYWQTRSN